MALSAPAWCRVEPQIMKTYTGDHRDAFLLQWDRVRLLTRQAQVEVTARLGLFQYREGFEWPLHIRFEDGAPAGIENALAYVTMSRTAEGFQQELVVNLNASERFSGEFDPIFYHEMTHAVLNDAVGGQAAQRIPPWVQEGLAQYVSGEGADRVAQAAGRVRKSQARALLHELDGPYTGSAYPQYYLAIHCMEDLHSVNAVQAFVRNLIGGKTVLDSIEDSTGLSWEKFQDEVRECSLKRFQDKARPDLE